MSVVAAYLYRNGKTAKAVSLDEPIDCKGKSEFVWIGLFEPSEQELSQLERNYGLHPLAIEDAFKATGYTVKDINWFVPHQANQRIIDDTAKKLGIAPEKVITTVGKHGNTSAASIPLALSTAVAQGKIKRGDLVMLEAMGGGFTWGSVLLRW